MSFKYSLLEPSLEECRDLNGDWIGSEEQMDRYIQELPRLFAKLSDRDAQTLCERHKLEGTLNKRSLEIRLNAIDKGFNIWKSLVAPVVEELKNLTADDYINRTAALKKLHSDSRALIDKLGKKVRIPGIGDVHLPKWSDELSKLYVEDMKAPDDNARLMKDIGYTSKSDIQFLTVAMKEFLSTNGKVAQFDKYVANTIDSKRLTTLYLEICKKRDETDQDDLEYGLSHYGPLRLLADDLEYAALHMIQEFVHAPFYLDRDVSDLAIKVKKMQTSFFGKLFGN